MVSTGTTYGLGAALLGVGGAVLFLYGDLATIDPWYMTLLVGMVSGMSFIVGYVLGYITDRGIAPGSEER
jgi:hypothetical protein